ncbi:MAG: hypothetical protein Q4E24_14440 [bacterium]|nr:hypothetical protein [bacterium]
MTDKYARTSDGMSEQKRLQTEANTQAEIHELKTNEMKIAEISQQQSALFYKLMKVGIYKELHQRSLLTDAQLNELLNN